jgi:hypothetical protein
MSPVLPAWLWLLALTPFAAPAMATQAAAAAAQTVAPAGQCDQAAAAAERQYALPPGILAAIGRVESGRADPASHALQPWPWSIDAGGAGSMAPTSEDAVAQVQALQARGMRNIDVGCFQVNLLYHPGAFPTLHAAFEPFANAQYAGRFLAALHQRTGSWDAAIMAYHSAWPAAGGVYRDKVLAVWGVGLAKRPGPVTDQMVDSQNGVTIYTPHIPGSAPAILRLCRSEMNTPVIITPNS